MSVLNAAAPAAPMTGAPTQGLGAALGWAAKALVWAVAIALLAAGSGLVGMRLLGYRDAVVLTGSM